jgi:hypothetical protein
VDERGYQRRLDVFEYQPRRRDVPRDIGELLALAREHEEAEEKIILDYGECLRQ